MFLPLHSLAGALLALLALAPADDEVVVETFSDGTTRAKIEVDAKGRRHGSYLEYHPNGKLAIQARYRAGELDGSYRSFHDNGKVHVQTAYRSGTLHGKYTEREEDGSAWLDGRYREGLLDGPFEVRDGKTRVSKQLWKRGELVDLDGIVPYPKDLGELRARVASILDRGIPLPAGESKKPKRAKRGVVLAAEEPPALAAGRDAALRRLVAYRYVCDVPYEGMSLDDAYNRKCQAASRLLARIGRLDHTPENPGLPEGEYRVAYEGTSSSNLSAGSDLPGSIDGYMDDSDPSNIARVGHRRWCLNPALQKTGFGITERFSAMWSFDSSRTSYETPDLICYPTRGWMPVEMFGERHAWSVGFPKRGLPRAKEIEVEVVALDLWFAPYGKPLELDHLGVVSNTLVFRPVGVDVSPGSRYLVTIRGLRDEVRYFVQFESLAD